MSSYINLSILIIARSDGSFEARASSQAGQGSTKFEPPFKLSDIGPGLLGPGTTRGRIVTGASDEAPPKSAEMIGLQLFSALFQGDVAAVLARTEGMVMGKQDSGVRIRLSFDLSQAGIAEVAALPWELLRRPQAVQPLLVSTQTVLVRSLDGPRPIMLRPLIGDLRVLLIQSNPNGTGALKLSAESLQISESLGRLKNVVVDEVEPVAEQILDKLADEAYHVIHYMGHGDFEADRGGMLLLEKEDGSPDLVSAAKFASWLADEPLRLVFLNACETGTTPQFAGPHPFSGVAAALVANGVPAVVAMQFPITDKSALAFSRTFYERISKGDAVDLAVAQGRKALFDDVDTEWATPVLFLRAEDGNLFDAKAPESAPARQKAAALAAPEPAPPPPPAPAENWWKRQSVIAQISMVIVGIMLLTMVSCISAFNNATVVDPNAATDATAPAADAEAAAPAQDPDVATLSNVLANVPDVLWQDDTDVNGNSQVWPEVEKTTTDWPDERVAAALHMLADAGDARAAYLYGGMLDRGDTGVTQDKNKASEYLLAAAKGGVPAAMWSVGVGYQRGEGQVKDEGLAREWLQKAVDAGSQRAQADLDALGAPPAN